jgi:tetratricopeptide (TPR) repeat protein
MNVRFCPQCGSPTLSTARFCVECGVRLEVPTSTTEVPTSAPGHGISAGGPSQTPPWLNLAPFGATFSAIVAVGILVAYGVMRQIPQREALRSTASQPVSGISQSVQDATQLPAGHPRVQLPKEARDFISNLGRKAEADPKDISMWDKYADVCLRAAAFDSSYYPKSANAYAHVLKLDPDDLDALRGVGNIDFDQRRYDEAIAAYEHYLSKKPNDPEVRTDLGTMLLSSGSADQAVLQYRKVLETHPSFFEATFNLGIAYGQMHQLDAARSAFEKARGLAPDADTRNRVMQMLAELGGNAMPAAQGGSKLGQPNATFAADSGSFKNAMEQMLRDLPIAGPKVASVQWASATRARVLMDDFPMDQMPPFATAKFLADLKSGIGDVKSAHDVRAPVEIDICDAASGRVMQSITE